MAIFGDSGFALACWGDTAGIIRTIAPFQSAVRAAAADRVFLVELYPVLPGRSVTEAGDLVMLFGAPPPFGALPAEFEAFPAAVTTPIYLSDKGFITTPGDSLPNINFSGLLTQPLKASRSLPLDPAADRKLAVQVGAIEVSNADGSLTTAFNGTDIASRPVRVKLGRRSDPYSDFGLVASLLGLDRYGSRASTWVTASDVAALLDVPLQPETYAGTGGLEGGSDLAGKYKPWGAGVLRNVPAVSIDPNTGQMFQLSYRRIAGVDIVRASGVAVSRMGGGTTATDYPDYASLAAADVPAGFYATCLAKGLIKLGTANTALITVDFRGDAAGAAGYVSTHAEIALVMLTDLLNLPPDQISAAAFVSLAAAVPGAAGYWVGTEAITATSAIASLFKGITGWVGSDLYGQITVGRIAGPDDRYPSSSFDTSNIFSDLAKVSLSGDLAYPNWRRSLGYAPNWRVMTSSEIAGELSGSSVSADQQLVAFLTSATRTVAQVSANAQSRYGKAMDCAVIDGYFAEEADAQAEIDRQIALFSLRPDGTPREAFSFSLGYEGLTLSLDMAVRVTWPDFGLDQGRVMVVTAIDLDCAAGTVTVTVWG